MADLNFLRKGGGSIEGAGIQRSIAQFLIMAFTVLSMVGIIGSFAGMGGLFLYFRSQSATLKELDEQLRAVEDDLRPELVNSLISTSNILSNVRNRLNRHVYSSRVFSFFEKNTHGNAYLTGMNFSFEENLITADIVVPNYVSFAQQVRLFEKAPSVESVDFDKPTVVEGAISFHLKIIMKPEIFLGIQ